MSTFDGKVKEFPDIRIDHFRLSNEPRRPPLAYFLSHVHSDHLQGLESCKSPFIYCSPATKEILLRLEKYPHRMNFAKGILETRKQTYRHLRKLLKTIPLETPTVIDLAPERSVRVTLFDANHCVGAVMFLIEGDGKAVLYTGDIRSELWWVNNLTRHPLLLPYASGHDGRKPLRQLDCIYLDTTFATKDNPYKHFPSKAEGTLELLQKVSKYPKDTLFYFDTWTFGYEDVWMALCGFLDCRVHVDDYRFKLYRALATGDEPRASEAARLFGYQCGNHMKDGCLTTRDSRLHSCEQGTGCEVFKKDYVRITPIISRHDGVEMAELGAGGGKGDLDQQHELEVGDTSALGMLMSLCATKLKDQPQLLGSVMEMLASLLRSPVQSIALDPSILHSDLLGVSEADVADLGHLPIDSLIPALTAMASQAKQNGSANEATKETGPDTMSESRKSILPKRITFPYSRHSSYTELCHLIEAFKPKDIWPCTVDKTNWSASQSMGFLFGHLYDSSCKFTHDQEMFQRTKGAVMMVPESRPVSPGGKFRQSGENTNSQGQDMDMNPTSGSRSIVDKHTRTGPAGPKTPPFLHSTDPEPREKPTTAHPPNVNIKHLGTKKRRHSSDEDDSYMTKTKRAESSDPSAPHQGHDSDEANPPTLLSPNEYTAAWQREAFEAALGLSSSDWNNISLVSVSGHQKREEEL